jgi:urease accessory protein
MRILNKSCVALGLLAAAGGAFAHPGHGESFFAGLGHPVLGMDHLLAMVAVGLWSAAALPAGKRPLGPLAFLGLLAAGAALGAAGAALPQLETGIDASVLILALLIAGARRLPAAAGLAVIAVAGALHGLAHGAELPVGASFIGYAAGFMSASVLLHGAGLGLGQWMTSARSWAWRALASGLGLAGLLLLARA